MLEVADRPVDTASDASHGRPAALNAVNHWVPHTIVMRDTWFPLAHSSTISQKPVRSAIYSHPYFIWRENGIDVASEFPPNERRPLNTSAYPNATGRTPASTHYPYSGGRARRMEGV